MLPFYPQRMEAFGQAIDTNYRFICAIAENYGCFCNPDFVVCL